MTAPDPITDAELLRQRELWHNKPNRHGKLVRALIEEVIESRRWYRGAIKR